MTPLGEGHSIVCLADLSHKAEHDNKSFVLVIGQWKLKLNQARYSSLFDV
jgi:hypothetical protein